ncbi:MAG TPA: hypothetical protein VFQ61_31495 [Polyangiaceae bacterium]|nr:hypothetical protein [Polyangiaceae bacterium]
MSNAGAETKTELGTKPAHEEGRFGYVHSEQTGSALDGPGLRTVFW